MKPFEQVLLSFLANASEAFLVELAVLLSHKINPQPAPLSTGPSGPGSPPAALGSIR